MKQITILFFAIFLFLLSNLTAQDWDANFQQLAKRITQTTANIKPGEVVVIEGGKYQTDFLEAISIETLKLGGLPTIFLTSDAIEYTIFNEVPDEYLDNKRNYLIEWFKEVDVWIHVFPSIENTETNRKNVSQEKLAKIRASRPFQQITEASSFRNIAVNYPAKRLAENYGTTFNEYQKIHNKAIDQDYNLISKNSKQLGEMLTNSREVHITTPEGTDLSFSVTGRPYTVEDGIVSEEEAKSENPLQRFAILPGGGTIISIIENSANGKVVIPVSSCGETIIKDMKFDFVKGEMQNIQATAGASCLIDQLENYDGPGNIKTISDFSIGLNPALRKLQNENTGLYNVYGEGMVLFTIGNNKSLGGNNDATTSIGFFLPNATVTIDGQVVVEKGKVKL